MTDMNKRSTAVLTAAILATVLTIPATAIAAPAKSIRVSSYKGSTLEVGERSGLIIGPSGTEYAVTSSDPDTVAVEQVLTFWVAVAKAEGTAEITASNSAGECGSMTLTVISTTPTTPKIPYTIPWRDLPERFGPWQSVYRRFRAWTKAGVWEDILTALIEQDLVEETTLMLDSTTIKVHQHASGVKKGDTTRKPDGAEGA